MKLLLLLFPLAWAEECREGKCEKRGAGLVLLQGVRKHSKVETGSLELEGCAGEGQDPFDPSFGRRNCCNGLKKCGPYFQESWGGWSFTCKSSCQEPGADDCGCVAPEGWSSSSNPPRCREGSSTDAQEAQDCRDRTSTTSTTSAESDDCGCVAPEGWSSSSNPPRCREGSSTDAQETQDCRDRTSTTQSTETTTTGPTTSFTGGSGPTPTELNVMSWNVFFGNSRFEAMADMLKSHEIDIANLQETNNKLERIAEASGYSSVNSWKQSHDWCGYNFHSPEWGSAWSKELDVPGSRGVCGAMIYKGEAKFCIWGLHPIQRGNNVRYAKESIEIAAEQMKYCSETYGAPTIFLGDFNTLDWREVRRKLERETGWGWALAAKHDIDFIFIQTSPLKVGEVISSEIVGDGTCWPGFPPNNGISRQCGYADHSPLWARIRL